MRCLSFLLLACFMLSCYCGSLLSMTEDWKAKILNSHNNARRQFKDVPDLVWHSGAQSQADKWVLELANNNACGLKHSSGSGFGENLAMWVGGTIDPSKGVQMWNNENKSFVCNPVTGYDMDKNCGGNWMQCGHYTQNIWKDTTGVGCALADCGSNKVVMSCNYYPPGNYRGVHPTKTCDGSTPPPSNPPPSNPPPACTTATVTQPAQTVTQVQTQTVTQVQTQTQTQTQIQTQTQTQTVTQPTQTVTETVNGNGDVVTQTVTATVSLTSTATELVPGKTETLTQTVTSTQTQVETVTQCNQTPPPPSTQECKSSDGARCINPATHKVYGGQFKGSPDCFVWSDGLEYCFRTDTETLIYPCSCSSNAMGSSAANYEPVQMNQSNDVVLSTPQLAGIIVGCVVGVVALVVAVFFIVSKSKKSYDSF